MDEKQRIVFNAVERFQLAEIALEIVSRLKIIKIWLFRGDLGSGKTTFIKEICRALGVQDVMSSPTFAIVNEYEAKEYKRIFHFDFYRLKNEAEAYDIGIEEYFYSDCPCFIEWPEKIENLLPDEFAEVYLTIENELQRTIAISVHVGKEKTRV